MLPGFARRRRRRNASSRTVSVTASGGVWTFTPGAGSFTNLTCATNVAPSSDDVGINCALGIQAYVGIGNTVSTVDGLSRGPVSLAASTPAEFPADNLDGGSFALSGQVTFTASDGAVTLYIFSAQAV